nr:MAG TPA_asm: hypothetical protein [Caudoviricetes sp.]
MEDKKKQTSQPNKKYPTAPETNRPEVFNHSNGS